MLHAILEDSPKLGDILREFISQANTLLTGMLSEETKALTKVAKTVAYVDEINFKFTKDENPSEVCFET